jgi:hypothetical protein
MINHTPQEIACKGFSNIEPYRRLGSKSGEARIFGDKIQYLKEAKAHRILRSIKGEGGKGREWATFKNNFQKRLTSLEVYVKRFASRFNRRGREVEATAPFAHSLFVPSGLHGHQYGSVSTPK